MQVEQIGKLERRVALSLPVADLEREVESRLKRLSRTVRMAGFRPGKVPLKMVSQQYGYQVHNEVLSEQLGAAFDRAIQENKLRVAGNPNIAPRAGDATPEGTIAFDATFEVYPEVVIGELSSIEVEMPVTPVGEAEIDKTIEILRKQRVHFHPKGVAGDHGDGGVARAAAGDRVTIDFAGRIDGTPFEGGTAADFAFVLGEGRMLPEFESAVTGLAPGESKTFELSFPEDYHGKDVAGKRAEFSVTVKGIEWAHRPEVDAEFARTLGIADGDLGKMREDIRANLNREVKTRIKGRLKEAVMNALAGLAQLELPRALVEGEMQRQAQATMEEMKSRGMTVGDKPLPPELFREQAERRVRLMLIVSELIRKHDLKAAPEQIKAHVEELAEAYENPGEVVRWYYADRQRLADVEALVLEETVVNYVVGEARRKETPVAFDDLMGRSGA
jgi:trigger factor